MLGNKLPSILEGVKTPTGFEKLIFMKTMIVKEFINFNG